MVYHKEVYWDHCCLLYINDLVDLCDEYASIYLFADDAKIFKHVKTSADQLNLQQACNTISKWSEKWLLPLNVSVFTANCQRNS